jgi:hypothetical protein
VADLKVGTRLRPAKAGHYVLVFTRDFIVAFEPERVFETVPAWR